MLPWYRAPVQGSLAVEHCGADDTNYSRRSQASLPTLSPREELHVIRYNYHRWRKSSPCIGRMFTQVSLSIGRYILFIL